MSFGCMIQSIFTFPADFKMLVKERQSGMYRLSAYYAARTIRCASAIALGTTSMQHGNTQGATQSACVRKRHLSNDV